MKTADDRRREALLALREAYVGAKRAAHDSSVPDDIRQFRRGVLEGIRCATTRLFGVVDELVVTQGASYIGNGAPVEDAFCPRHGRASRPIEVAGLLCVRAEHCD